mgnify:CR=1 FL=1
MATRFSFEVCILTYNRAELLRQALDALSVQTDGNFAVAVYDNASRDETPQTVESFREKFGARLRYVRHGENIGADANFHSAVSGAAFPVTPSSSLRNGGSFSAMPPKCAKNSEWA